MLMAMLNVVNTAETISFEVAQLQTSFSCIPHDVALFYV